MKGKKLKVGQHVLIVKAPDKKGVSVTVLTVLAVEHPFVVFEFDCENHPMIVLAPAGPQISTGPKKETFTMDVRRCRFKAVGDEFVAASRGIDEVTLPKWITEPDGRTPPDLFGVLRDADH